MVSPGLANGLVKLFESQHEISVKTLTLCTGDAIEFVKEHEGIEEIDVMIGHDEAAEKRFINDGYAVGFRQVCYSEFVLVGPPDDPAKVKGMKDILKALKRIAATKSKFCSRADLSGTHALEMKLWKSAGVKPGGDWYIETKVGTSETLIIAQRIQAYFISHQASYVQMHETIDLPVMVEDPSKLFTNYDAVAMNPERFPNVNYAAAMLFIGFLTSPETQKYIAEFGSEQFSRPPFVPLADKYNQQKKDKK